jgi:dienelactone hydrolase
MRKFVMLRLVALVLSTIVGGCDEDASNDTTPSVGPVGTSIGAPNNGAAGGTAAGAAPPATAGAGGLATTPGGGGIGAPTPGAGGTPGTTPSPVTPSTGGAGGVGSPSGGGTVAGTGATGASGGATGGTGGATGGTGSATGGTGGSAPGGSIMRGDDPTSASASTKGPFKVMSYTSGFPVNLYGGGTIWYPTDATPPFGAVAVCPGFVSAQSSIMGWGSFLASHGIVAITIDTLTPLDVVDQRAEELMDALASIKSENMRSGGPLFNKIDTMRMGVMGWSMGGGGSWLAASAHPELRTAVTFAGHIVTALNQDVSTNKVPTLMFAGSNDDLILGGAMSQPVYDGIPESTPKMVWEVNGAGHDVANDPSRSSGAVGRYGLSWQKVFLEGDMRYRKFLLEMPPNASYFKTNVK